MAVDRKEQTILISIAANVLLIILRFVLADMSGSLALKANAWHSLADVVVLGIVYLGLVVARQKVRRYESLIARTENLVAIIVAGFILWMGVELFSEAVAGEALELAYVVPSAIGAFLGVCITYFMGRYMLFVGHETNSPSLIAGGLHARMDMFCSAAVLVGLVGSIFGLSGLDKVVAVIVVVFIFMAAIELLVSNLRALASTQAQIAAEHDHARRPGKRMIVGLGILVAGAYLVSGLFYVQPDESAVVRRLGRAMGEPRGPGLHYRLPFPLERVNLIKTTPVRQITTGKRLLLSGDENLVDVEMAVHYRVSDAARYLLNVSAPDALVKNAAQSSVRRTVAHMPIDSLLADGRTQALAEIKSDLQGQLNDSGSGLEVGDVLFLKLRPPEDVVDAFQDVASAREDKMTYMNEAYSYRNALVPKARGDAATTVLQAQAGKVEKTRSAEGEASRFTKKLAEYSRSPDITRTRLYLEAVEKVLPNMEKFLVGGNVKLGGTDLWFLGKDANPVIDTK